jgi:nucleotide-binding universal stress UspA family protein
MREDRNYLERVRGELMKENLNVEIRLECGDPAQEILNTVQREKCELIAMATHGHRFVKDVILGSVVNAVRHRTDVPMLLVRKPGGKSAGV